MRCEDFLTLIEKLADGEATATEKHEAEAHLGTCENCRAHFRFVRALPDAGRRASLPEPPELYWEVLPRKIMSRIGNQSTALVQRSWLSRLLPPSRLGWAGALAAALVAAVVGLRVLDVPFADRGVSSPSPALSSSEQESNVAISRQDTPTSALDDRVGEAPASSPESVADAFKEETPAFEDEAPEQAVRSRPVAEPLPAPGKAQERFVGGALTTTAEKTRPEKQGPAREGAELPEPAVAGRLKKDLEEVGSRRTDEKGQFEAKRRSTAPVDDVEPVDPSESEAERVPQARPASPAPVPAERDSAAQSISFARSLEVEPAPGESRPSAEESYRDLVTRFPLPDTESGSKLAANRSKDKPSDPSGGGPGLEAQCAAWRGFVERYPGSEQEPEARYRLARCSIALFDILPSEENRLRAREDGASYLEVAATGERAEAIREALARLAR
jgi:hypothetical protein